MHARTIVRMHLYAVSETPPPIIAELYTISESAMPFYYGGP